MSLEDLTEFERKTYEIIKKAVEIQPKNLPDPRMMGAVASLRAKGLVEVFKKYATRSRSRKKKFVRIKETKE